MIQVIRRYIQTWQVSKHTCIACRQFGLVALRASRLTFKNEVRILPAYGRVCMKEHIAFLQSSGGKNQPNCVFFGSPIDRGWDE